MHTIRVIGGTVKVVTSEGKTYLFSKYGDYELVFEQEEVQTVCAILDANGAQATSSSLTDCILTIRKAARQLPN